MLIILQRSAQDVLKNYNSIIDSLKGKVLTNINIDDISRIAKKELKDIVDDEDLSRYIL